MNFIIESPKFQIIELAELKRHLRIEHDYEDEYLNKNIEMATSILENYIERPILKKKYKYLVYCNDNKRPYKIELPVRDVNLILSVKQKSLRGICKRITFSVDMDRDRTFILINEAKYPIEIKYSAGLIERPAEVPGDLRYAILQIAKNIYSCNNEDILASDCIKNIVDKYRRVTIN
ncbi:MAG: head-tail connector protein [Holosporales bacterium]|jgi:uncharacterized phiE125 gp8 family phage protein|nr:head-tail connector protein [Holosporales bacterium]